MIQIKVVVFHHMLVTSTQATISEDSPILEVELIHHHMEMAAQAHQVEVPPVGEDQDLVILMLLVEVIGHHADALAANVTRMCAFVTS